MIAWLAALVSLACGGEQKGATDKDPTAAAAAPAATAFSASPLTPDPAASRHRRALSDAVGNYFKPAEVHAKPGDVVRYTLKSAWTTCISSPTRTAAARAIRSRPATCSNCPGSRSTLR